MRIRPATALLTLALACGPQQGELHGIVTDLRGMPLAAMVQVEGLSGAEYADATGAYAVSLPLGRFVVRYEAAGHLPEQRSWELFAANTLQAAPVRLAPTPEGPGLWMGSAGALSRVPEAQLVSDLTQLEGMFSAYRASWRVEGAATPWCAGEPLIYRADDESQPRVRATALDQTRRLLAPDGQGPAGVTLNQTCHAQGVCAVAAPERGGLVLLTTGATAGGMDPLSWTGHLLEVRACEPAHTAAQEAQ